MKPVIFSTQYNSLGLNINSVIKKHLPIIMDTPCLNENFLMLQFSAHLRDYLS